MDEAEGDWEGDSVHSVRRVFIGGVQFQISDACKRNDTIDSFICLFSHSVFIGSLLC